VKITVTIQPGWTDATDVFGLRAAGEKIPLLVKTIKRPIMLSFEHNGKTIEIPFGDDPQAPQQESKA